MEDKPEFEIADVLCGFEVGGITSQELRKILIELGWPLERTQNSASTKL